MPSTVDQWDAAVAAALRLLAKRLGNDAVAGWDTHGEVSLYIQGGVSEVQGKAPPGTRPYEVCTVCLPRFRKPLLALAVGISTALLARDLEQDFFPEDSKGQC